MRETDKFSICWFILQMAAIPAASVGQSQESKASSPSPTWAQGPKHLGGSMSLSQVQYRELGGKLAAGIPYRMLEPQTLSLPAVPPPWPYFMLFKYAYPAQIGSYFYLLISLACSEINSLILQLVQCLLDVPFLG